MAPSLISRAVCGCLVYLFEDTREFRGIQRPTLVYISFLEQLLEPREREGYEGIKSIQARRGEEGGRAGRGCKR